MPYPARVLGRGDVRRLLAHVAANRHAYRDRVVVLLSFKSGLRACEIAGLAWPMVLQPRGQIAAQLFVARTIAKNGAARHAPMHPDLAAALRDLHHMQGRPAMDRSSAPSAASATASTGTGQTVAITQPLQYRTRVSRTELMEIIEPPSTPGSRW